MLVKTPEARYKLAKELHNSLDWKVKPTRRVYIPKPNGKSRPLGIPTIRDRCLQAIVKNALEPCWEARFEGISYGFRPGRSCHDAIAKIFLCVGPHRRKKWIVDADISGCFDNINHKHLLANIGNFPGRKLTEKWLKAGYIDSGVFNSTNSGTPQGGIISPLLANIALHGMEEALGIKYNCRGEVIGSRIIIRYADDCVILCESEEDAKKAQNEINEWLKPRGLSLSSEKTKIVHITEGFNFLGFNIRHYKVTNTATGYKLLIKPSKKSIKEFKAKIRQTFLEHHGKHIDLLIGKINPMIRGWANYFRIGVSSKVFASIDRYIYTRTYRYIKRMHPNKSKRWRDAKYYGYFNLKRKNKWVFGNKANGNHIIYLAWTNIERHILVKGRNSPDDPLLKKYWENRTKKENAKEAQKENRKAQTISKRQNYTCPTCKDSIYNGEPVHLHHKVPRCKGGSNRVDNLVYLHQYCHHKEHHQD